MAFAARLRELREAANLTQGQLAQIAGMSARGVSHLEQGLREPGWDTVQKLAVALGVGVEAFSVPTADTPLAPKRGRPRKPAPNAVAGSAPSAAAKTRGKKSKPKGTLP